MNCFRHAVKAVFCFTGNSSCKAKKILCPAEREMGFSSAMDESKTVAACIRRSRFLVLQYSPRRENNFVTNGKNTCLILFLLLKYRQSVCGSFKNYTR